MGGDPQQDRKRYLLLRSRILRAQLGHDFGPLASTAFSIESAAGILARLRRHPEWLAGAALALVLLRPDRLSAWLRGTTLGLRTWRRALPLLMALTRR